jgi:release factor glutamine methyltransferase
VEKHLSSKQGGVSFGELVAIGEAALKSSSPSARLDAEVLLAHVSGFSRSLLLAHFPDPCSKEVYDAFLASLAKREQGEPVAYITGHREFWGLEFVVNQDVLIPRPESELVVEEALKVCSAMRKPTVVDLGTGSGCLIISLAHELIKTGATPRCTAVDSSAAALAVAYENATRHAVLGSLTFKQSDWFSPRETFAPPYDVVIANPPYIDRSEQLPRDVTFEPQSALFSAECGLADTSTIIMQASEMVAAGGVVLIEVGAGKRTILREWFHRHAVPFTYEFLGDDREVDSFTVVKLVRR